MKNLNVKTIVLGLQVFLVAFGATVLAPLLAGTDPSLALFGAGVGTLASHLVTKGSVPVFLSSSFAFIGAIATGTKIFGIGAIFGAIAVCYLVYVLVGLILRNRAKAILDRFLPPVVCGTIITIIGISLAPAATGSVVSFVGGGDFDLLAFGVAMFSIAVIVGFTVYGKGVLKRIPVIMAIIFGYILCILLGKVDTSVIANAPWFVSPWTAALEAGRFARPTFSIAAIFFVLPVFLTPLAEHIGDLLTLSGLAKKDFINEPGLTRTLTGNAVGSVFSVLLGGFPSTSYSEVTGTLALIQDFNPAYMWAASVFAILASFCGKLNAILLSIPAPVMGGALMVLLGMVSAMGIHYLSASKIDFTRAKNSIIMSVMLIAGAGNLKFAITNDLVLAGIGLCGLLGVILNLVIPDRD
jgi:uracil permease